MSQPINKDSVISSLAALGLPVDPDVVDAVCTHDARLSALSALFMEMTIPDEVETPSIFEP